MVTLLLTAILATAPVAGDNYLEGLAKFRLDQEESIKRKEGWLNVAGLYWLDPGDNTIGSGAGSKVVLPFGAAPNKVGLFSVLPTGIHFTPEPGSGVIADGKPAAEMLVRTDADGNPTHFEVRDLVFKVIKRGPKVAIRLYDPNNPGRKGFTGRKWFEPDTVYKVVAKFTAYDPPRKIAITNVIGMTDVETCPGFVTFKIGTLGCRLDAIDGGDTLFFNFHDRTSGKETYPAGRFLDADKPVDGLVTLDFNKATNPPCAFTHFATCPLPPRSNFMSVAIPAGEKAYHLAED